MCEYRNHCQTDYRNGCRHQCHRGVAQIDSGVREVRIGLNQIKRCCLREGIRLIECGLNQICCGLRKINCN